MTDGDVTPDIVNETAANALQRLAMLGFCLFPLTPKSKKPCVDRWPERATAELAQLEQWQREFRDCNLGIATGEASGIFVIDIDGEAGVSTANLWTTVHGDDWKTTRIVRTPSDGFHLYYQWPNQGPVIRNSQKEIGPGVDVRGQGGFVVAPGSFVTPPDSKKSGTYTVINPDQTISPAPPWLLEELWNVERTRGRQPISSVSSADGKIAEGQRNGTLASLAGSMRKRGMSQDAIVAALKVENSNRCSPPLDESEVESIATSISRYAPGQPAVVNSGDWPEPQSLGSELLPVEPFSLEFVPSSLRPMIDDISERMQAPPDFSAAGAVVSLAGCVNRRGAIRPKRLDTWEVIPNLWGMIVAPPGFLKSPNLNEVTRPLVSVEELWRETYKQASSDHESELETAKLRRQAWSEAYKRALKKKDQPLPVAPDDSIQTPAQKRLLIGDATFEKLHEILSENPAGVLSVRDELVGWLGELQKPGRESERGFYLQAWNGAGGFSVDRIGRGTVYVPHVCLSLIGNIQPTRLRSYLREALTGGASDDGLLQRFQILVWPDVQRSWKNIDRVPNHTAILAVEKIFTTLANLSADVPIVLRFSAEAQQLFDAWRTELEAKVRGEGNLHPALIAHLSKYRSLLPSLAGLFELADIAAGGGDLSGEVSISLDHARQAAAFCHYLETHARRAYGCMVSPEMAAARELARHLSAGDLPDTFTTRDVYRRGWSGLTQPEQARKALELLADSEWVRQLEPTPSVTGGRPTETWQINPGVNRRCKIDG